MTPRAVSKRPSLRVERALQREGHRVLAGMDAVIAVRSGRERLVPGICRWALAHAVGHASPGEVDNRPR